MPGVSRCDLTNACAFYHTHCTRGYRAHRTPGIPCALSEWRGRNEQAKPRAKQAARSRSCVFRRCRCLKIEIGVHANILVMPGLDPGIHPSTQEAPFEEDGLPGQARQRQFQRYSPRLLVFLTHARTSVSTSGSTALTSATVMPALMRGSYSTFRIYWS
jgi:hypothetical protein